MSKGPQIEISVEDRVARQAAQATLDIANREIDRINVEIGKLMARRTAQEGIAAEARAVLVNSPCDDPLPFDSEPCDDPHCHVAGIQPHGHHGGEG